MGAQRMRVLLSRMNMMGDLQKGLLYSGGQGTTQAATAKMAAGYADASAAYGWNDRGVS